MEITIIQLLWEEFMNHCLDETKIEEAWNTTDSSQPPGDNRQPARREKGLLMSGEGARRRKLWQSANVPLLARVRGYERAA